MWGERGLRGRRTRRDMGEKKGQCHIFSRVLDPDLNTAVVCLSIYHLSVPFCLPIYIPISPPLTLPSENRRHQHRGYCLGNAKGSFLVNRGLICIVPQFWLLRREHCSIWVRVEVWTLRSPPCRVLQTSEFSDIQVNTSFWWYCLYIKHFSLVCLLSSSLVVNIISFISVSVELRNYTSFSSQITCLFYFMTALDQIQWPWWKATWMSGLCV